MAGLRTTLWLACAVLGVALFGCHLEVDRRGGSAGYAACNTSPDCGYRDETCYDVGGAGLCTGPCVYNSDCPSRNGWAGLCRTSPTNYTVCYQSCQFDRDCPASNACSAGVCVPIIVSTGLPNYERCTQPADCDPAYSQTCALTDTQNRGMCSSSCQYDTDCLPRGSVPGVCRTVTELAGDPAICFLSCAGGGVTCPAGTACNGDVCLPI